MNISGKAYACSKTKSEKNGISKSFHAHFTSSCVFCAESPSPEHAISESRARAPSLSCVGRLSGRNPSPSGLSRLTLESLSRRIMPAFGRSRWGLFASLADAAYIGTGGSAIFLKLQSDRAGRPQHVCGVGGSMEDVKWYFEITPTRAWRKYEVGECTLC